MSPSYNGLRIRNHSMNSSEILIRSLRVSEDNLIMRQTRPSCCFPVGSLVIGSNKFQKILTFYRRCSVANTPQEIFNVAIRNIIKYLQTGKTKSFFPVMVLLKKGAIQHGGFPCIFWPLLNPSMLRAHYIIFMS